MGPFLPYLIHASSYTKVRIISKAVRDEKEPELKISNLDLNPSSVYTHWVNWANYCTFLSCFSF